MATANQNIIDLPCRNIDAPCWERLKSGNPDALGYLYDRYVDALFAAALRLTPDRHLAQDAIQEVFVGLWQYRNGIGIVHHSLAYLQKSLRNILLRQLQATVHHADPTEDEFTSADAGYEELLISKDREKETSHRLNHALSFLSQRQRQIVSLHFYEGLSYEQIAEKLRMNYQSVNNLAYRTMLRLRNHMLPLLFIGLALT